MGLEWLLVPAVGGYWFLTHANFTRFVAHRESGHHLLLRSAAAGLVLVVVAHIAVLCVDHAYPSVKEVWRQHVLQVEHSRTFFGSALLGVLLPPVCNIFYGKKRAASRAATQSGDLVELLIAESIKRQDLIEVSLKSRKVYIGLALDLTPPVRGASDVAITPFWSGYRDADTCEVTVTTHYVPVLERQINQSDPESPAETETLDLDPPSENSPAMNLDPNRSDLRIVIPKSEIGSVRLFDIDVYNRLAEPSN